MPFPMFFFSLCVRRSYVPLASYCISYCLSYAFVLYRVALSLTQIIQRSYGHHVGPLALRYAQEWIGHLTPALAVRALTILSD